MAESHFSKRVSIGFTLCGQCALIPLYRLVYMAPPSALWRDTPNPICSDRCVHHCKHILRCSKCLLHTFTIETLTNTTSYFPFAPRLRAITSVLYGGGLIQARRCNEMSSRTIICCCCTVYRIHLENMWYDYRATTIASRNTETLFVQLTCWLVSWAHKSSIMRDQIVTSKRTRGTRVLKPRCSVDTVYLDKDVLLEARSNDCSSQAQNIIHSIVQLICGTGVFQASQMCAWCRVPPTALRRYCVDTYVIAKCL